MTESNVKQVRTSMTADSADVRPFLNFGREDVVQEPDDVLPSFCIVLQKKEQKEHTLHNASIPISNPEVETEDEMGGIIGYKKRRMSLKPRLAGVFQRIQSYRSNVLWVHLSQ